MGIAEFNGWPDDRARTQLEACLAVPRWINGVLAGRPYPGTDQLMATADALAAGLTEHEVETALARHPRIGERPTAEGTEAEHSRREQSGLDPADAEVAERLRRGNQAYEQRFGRVFLIRAAGRPAPEILSALERRLTNDDATELVEVREQLGQIARLRLEQLVE